MVTRYLSAEKLREDDFGDVFTMQEGEIVYDARTRQGPWATMSQRSYQRFAASYTLGIGHGQKYRRNSSGELILEDGA